jgi:hypothetical protein
MRVIHLAVPLAAAMLCGSVTSRADDGWASYENGRFGTALEVPAGDMEALPAPANGDGQGWLSSDGRTELTVWGSFWGASAESWDDYRVQQRRWMLENKVILTYAPEGADWFVLSGRQGDRILYLRVNRSSRCADIAHHLLISHPAAQTEMRDGWVGVLSKSLGEVPAVECP